MTLTFNGNIVTDSYGTISPGEAATTELGNGAHPGWYSAWTTTGPEIGVLYDLTITPAALSLQSKDQCEDGGFTDFGFANQGQCIASIQANGNANK